MPRQPLDVAIIGAGVSGLAAARRLVAAGLSIRVLEARPRLGGRILTLRDARVAAPIELGAEFIHGKAEPIAKIAKEGRLASYEITGGHRQTRNGRVASLPDFWDRIGAVLERIGDARREDESLRDALARKPGGRALARARTLTRDFVEGFHAADASRVSAQAVAGEGNPGDDHDARRMGRLVDGFDTIPGVLATGVDDALTLGAEVRAVTWRKGHVELQVRGAAPPDERLTARAVVVTVPLGVLHAPAGERGSIAFDPVPARVFRHASRLAMGDVVRMAFLVDDAFWSRAVPNGDEDVRQGCFAFLHTRDADVPVWWTQFPLRAPVVVAWAGGPRATRLTGTRAADLRQIAMRSLARSLGVQPRRLTRLVRDAWMHDWTADPFSRGAYSYPLVGGTEAARGLARPVDGTLFFAGEATDTEGENGTVHGAISSGYRAAAQVLRALG